MSINSFEANVLTQIEQDLVSHASHDTSFLLSTDPHSSQRTDESEISDFPDGTYQNSRSVYDGPEESYAMERVNNSPLHKLIK